MQKPKTHNKPHPKQKLPQIFKKIEKLKKKGKRKK